MFLKKLTAVFRGLPVKSEVGQTLVEYSMIIALIAIAAIAGISAVAGGVDSLWGNIVTKVGDAVTEVLGG